MSKFTPSTTRIVLFVLAASALVVLAWPYLAGNRASVLVAQAGQGSRESLLDYQLANILDPHNVAAAAAVAQAHLASDPARALRICNRAGDSAALDAVYVKALLELGLRTDAANFSRRLVVTRLTDDATLTVAFSFALTGQQSHIPALASRLSSPAALQRLQRIEAGNVALSDELAASGLLRSSSALLATLPDSAPRDIRLASLKSLSPYRVDQMEASKLYSAYLQAMPADIAARQNYANLWQTIYSDRHFKTARGNICART